MKKSVLFFLMVTLLFASCEESTTTAETNDSQKDVVETPPTLEKIATKELDIKKGDKINTTRYVSANREAFLVIDDKSMGASLSLLKVVTKGLAARKDTIDFGEVNPLDRVMQADLNEDGIAELYFFLRSAGSGGYGEVAGITYDKDKKVSKIVGYEMTAKEFEGYMGHDVFSIEGNNVVTTYPVYKEGDANATPSGGKAKVFFGLQKGKGAWNLVPVKREATK